MRAPSLLVALALALPSAACVTRVDVAPARSARAASALPPFVVASSGAVLRLAEDAKVRLARPRAGLPLRMSRTPDGRPWAIIDGGIQVAGVVERDRLGVFVCEPGPLGDHFYAGNDNRLDLRSGVENEQVRVAGQVSLRALPWAKDLPFEREFRELAFEATIPVARLCTGPLPKRHAGTKEDPSVAQGYAEPDEEDFPKGTRVADVPKSTALTLLDRPGGAPLHTLPANEWGFVVVWLGREGAWDRVAIGGGPYLVGWVPSLEPRSEEYGVGGLGLLGAMADTVGPWSLRTKALVDKPLFHLRAGTSIVHFGAERARLVKPGFARVTGGPREGFVYVVAAVDDDVTVEGWVLERALGPRVDEREKRPTAPAE